MNVAILTWGSRGDVQPYIALAAAFRERGHNVRLGAPPNRALIDLAEQHGLEIEQLGAALSPCEWTATANEAIASPDPARSLRLIVERLMLPSLDAMLERALELAEWADVVVTHFFQLAGRMAGERSGRPFVTGTLVPTQIPTATRSPGAAGDLGSGTNVERWRAATSHINAALLRPVNEARRRFGLPPLDDLAVNGYYSPTLNLVGASPLVFPRPHDWASCHRITGFWFLGTPPAWTPPRAVVDFLASGAPPVVISFGSMSSEDSAALTELIVGAVRDARIRAIIEPGLAGLGVGARGEDVLVNDEAPHSWLLPRAAAFVHHGGIGSAAAAFRAGVPSVVVPHVFDQQIWAMRAQELGVAPPPLPLKALTRDRLATALRDALTDRSMRARSRMLGRALSREQGAMDAVRLVEELMNAGATVVDTAAK